MERVIVSQDYLYEYLTGHDVKLNRLNELMGVSNGGMMGCFHHAPNRHGNPLSFSAANIEKMNAVLPILAGQIRDCVIKFGSDQAITTRLGRTYDPGTVPAVKALSKFFNLNSLLCRLLGWEKGKKNAILNAPSSKGFGLITSDDIMRLNAELMQVANSLAGMEVEMPTRSNSSDSSSSSNN